MSEKSEWNYNQIMMIKALLANAQNDLDITLHRGYIHEGMVQRISKMLTDAADTAKRMKT